jgi:hypothetical protein
LTLLRNTVQKVIKTKATEVAFAAKYFITV